MTIFQNKSFCVDTTKVIFNSPLDNSRDLCYTITGQFETILS